MSEWEMDSGHVTEDDVQDVYEQRIDYTDLAVDKLGHLLTKCRECGLNAALAMLEAQGVEGAESAPVERLEVLKNVRRLGPEGLKLWAEEEADELLAVDAAGRRALLDGAPHRFRMPYLVDELLERCQAQLTRDGHQALELAELAVEISVRVDPEVFHDLSFHSRARAAAHRANCLRLNDQAHAAAEAFRHARRLYAQAGIPDPEVEAEIPYLEAAIDQRRFEEADAMLDRAAELYRGLDQPRDLALTRIKQGNLQYHRGRPSAGLPALEEAASLLDLEREPKLHVTIRFSQALYAAEAGDAALARQRYRKHQELLESIREPWLTIRMLWLRAKIARAEGDLGNAGELYGQAREGFLGEGLAYDAAMVTLELAALYLERENPQGVRRLAAEMATIFGAQEIQREVLAALLLFERAARTETLTVSLTLRLRRFLELARRDPSLRLQDLGLGT